MSRNPNSTSDIIGTLGPSYSFHDVVRVENFPNNNHKLYEDFDSIFRALINKEIDIAIVATNNSIHGEIKANLDPIAQLQLSCVKKILLPIELHLASIEKLEIEEIKQIYAHPIAWNECLEYLNKMDAPNHIPSTSNAQAVIDLMESNNRAAACITGALPINKYSLHTIKKNIETTTPNITTFQILKK